jgi:hypothetical protein
MVAYVANGEHGSIEEKEDSQDVYKKAKDY